LTASVTVGRPRSGSGSRLLHAQWVLLSLARGWARIAEKALAQGEAMARAAG